VNGQFPGPLVEANYGDTIRVKVTNKLHDEGTSMHWHGFLQTGTNQMDGVPGLTQCAIAPNVTMTYTFRAELYGTAWNHTHYSAQYAGGAVGPIVIYGPTNKQADIDIGPVMLSDWYRNDYMTSIRGSMRPVSEGGPINPLTNSNLINGKMRFPCSKTKLECTNASYSTFKFTSGKNHLLRLVNTGSNAVQNFAIDGYATSFLTCSHSFY
jgi:FtsP/CotA-like multicopper oxidase with cupredoxin domain